MSEPKTFYLVDAHGYLHRAFHALPPLTNSKGQPVGALYGFLRVLQKIIRQSKPDCLVVCFDSPGPTFRHNTFKDYKAHRKELDEGLKFQLPLAKDFVQAWGLPLSIAPGYEADDLIATLATDAAEKGMRVTVVTGDKDALQLVDDNISVAAEPKPIVYDAAEVERKYGLRPDQLVDYFALTGDASDNVPGVPGVGDKTATMLLKSYGNLEGIYGHLDEVKGSLKEKLAGNKEIAWLSRKLVTLDRRAPAGLKPAACSIPEKPAEAFFELLKKYEFNTLLPQFSAAPKQGGAAPPGPGTTAAETPETAVEGKRNLHIVRTGPDLDALVKALRPGKPFAVDTETTGIDALACGLVGIALSDRAGEAWYVPVNHVEDRYLSLAEIQKALAPVFADPGRPKVGHNLKFDGQVLARHGLPLANASFDTLVASYCLNPGRTSHGLKNLALEFLGEAMTPIDALIGKGAKQITMDQVPVEKAAPYAGADAEVALRLQGLFSAELRDKKMETLFHEVEMPLVGILSEMERNGIQVNVPYLKKQQAELGETIAALEKEVHALAGAPFNLNSPKQLGEILFTKLGLPVIRKTKTGYSTDEDVLLELGEKHALPGKLLAYREMNKLKSTYVDALIESARKETSRVHTKFNQAVAATGRLSSTDPNLQNIPIRTELGRRIRRAFVPAKGCVFFAADYSQIDLRVLAHISGDKALSKAFKGGDDIHMATAREIFNLKPGDPVDPEQRRVAKSVNFGIVYGQTGFGLSQQLGIPMDRARAYIDTYMARYAGVGKWIDAILAKARKEGFVTTLLNRRRYLPDINSKGPARGFAERTAMNTPIQGTSADIIKIAMIHVDKLIKERGWKTKLLLQVHDDLLFEVPEKEFPLVVEPVREAMQNAMKLDVPVLVDVKSGENWADLDKFDA